MYDKYLRDKYKPHQSRVLIRSLAETIQFSFLPGDPGDEELWEPDAEPQAALIDYWASHCVHG